MDRPVSIKFLTMLAWEPDKGGGASLEGIYMYLCSLGSSFHCQPTKTVEKYA